MSVLFSQDNRPNLQYMKYRSTWFTGAQIYSEARAGLTSYTKAGDRGEVVWIWPHPSSVFSFTWLESYSPVLRGPLSRPGRRRGCEKRNLVKGQARWNRSLSSIHSFLSHLLLPGNGVCNCGVCDCWDGWTGNACEIWLGTEYWGGGGGGGTRRRGPRQTPPLPPEMAARDRGRKRRKSRKNRELNGNTLCFFCITSTPSAHRLRCAHVCVSVCACVCVCHGNNSFVVLVTNCLY